MTPEAQRIAIAEACGWKRRGQHGLNGLVGVVWSNGPTTVNASALPDYLNDMNAMHEAEKVLTRPQIAEYQMQLRLTTKEGMASDWNMLHATAAQRAEAFLRTIGKWTDTKGD